MKLLYSQYTDVGGRGNNEDALAVAVAEHGHLFLVADGLGGHDNGEEASNIAVEEIKRRFLTEGTRFDPERAIRAANELILKKQQEEGSSMKTTVTLAWVGDAITRFAHVGDSRIYAFNQRGIVYQSPDHSVSQLAVATGEISAAQIRSHRDRNKLTRALGVSEDVKAHLYTVDNSDYSGILMCSDGLWEYVYEDEMCASFSNAKTPKEWIDKMRVLHARRVDGSHDNNTAIAVIKAAEPMASMPAPSFRPPVYASAPRGTMSPKIEKKPKGNKTIVVLSVVAVLLLLVIIGLIIGLILAGDGKGKKADDSSVGAFDGLSMEVSEENKDAVNESDFADESFVSETPTDESFVSESEPNNEGDFPPQEEQPDEAPESEEESENASSEEVSVEETTEEDESTAESYEEGEALEDSAEENGTETEISEEVEQPTEDSGDVSVGFEMPSFW